MIIFLFLRIIIVYFIYELKIVIILVLEFCFNIFDDYCCLWVYSRKKLYEFYLKKYISWVRVFLYLLIFDNEMIEIFVLYFLFNGMFF